MAYPMTSWVDLSDDELAERLIRRGMPPPDAAGWVYYREVEGAAQVINRILEGDE